MLATGSRLAAVLVCHLAVVIGLPGSAVAQERLLYMSVTSAAGDPVLDLQVDEVQIQLAGAACRIVDLQPETDGMKVALIVVSPPRMSVAVDTTSRPRTRRTARRRTRPRLEMSVTAGFQTGWAPRWQGR